MKLSVRLMYSSAGSMIRFGMLSFVAAACSLATGASAHASSYPLNGFRASDGTVPMTVSIYGADAKAIFTKIRNDSPSRYSISRHTSGTNLLVFEHIRGDEVFCAKDSWTDLSTKKTKKVTWRCDIVVSGTGVIGNSITYQGDIGSIDSGGYNGGSDGYPGDYGGN